MRGTYGKNGKAGEAVGLSVFCCYVTVYVHVTGEFSNNAAFPLSSVRQIVLPDHYLLIVFLGDFTSG